MFFIGPQARTSIALAAAGGAVIAALLLTPSTAPPRELSSTSSDILSAKLVSSKILAGDREQDIAVTITMPRGATDVRPPLSLAIVIDRSGSMEGEPLANAKLAAAQLVGQLSSRDAFSVVTYSSVVETVVPLTRATDTAKRVAQSEIAKIWDDGNTCISCGIEQGAGELARTPIEGGVRRMVLISDGQANMGVYDRNELAQLAVETAARGVSISTVGVGLDFDEVTMTRLADVGHGHYYFVEDTAKLGEMFAEELGGLTETVGADARLVISQQGAHVEEAYGYPIMRQGDQDVVPIADLRAGETRKVVLRSTIGTSATGALPVAAFELHWRRTTDGRQATARATLATTIVTDPAQVAASIDRAAVNAVEQARTARVLEEATSTYETQGAEAAQRVIERNVARVRANKNMDAPAMQAIEAASSGASSNFATAPATKAKKATRADAYKLAH